MTAPEVTPSCSGNARSRRRLYVASDGKGTSSSVDELEKVILALKSENQELIRLNNELLAQNQKLTQRNSSLIKEREERFSTQEKRIQAITEIGKLENMNIFDDSEQHRMNASSRNLENLTTVTINGELEKRNKVVVAAVNAFTNKQTDSNDKKSAMRRLMAVELLYSARNLNYISDFCSMVQAVIYSFTHSKVCTNLIGHFTPSGAYYTVRSWLDNLRSSCLPAPVGLIEYAFDNEQRLLRTWLSRNGNKQTLEILTNTIVVQHDKNSDLQKDANFKHKNWPKPPKSASELIQEMQMKVDWGKGFCDIIFQQLPTCLADDNTITTKVQEYWDSLQNIVCPICKTVYDKSKKKCRPCNIYIYTAIHSYRRQPHYFDQYIYTQSNPTYQERFQVPYVPVTCCKTVHRILRRHQIKWKNGSTTNNQSM